MNAIKIFKNCKIQKLREYAQSYGNIETILIPFIKEFSNEIHLLDDEGKHTRTMRKGTKLLKGFSGVEISERSFKILTGKNKRANDIIKAERKAVQEAENEIFRKQNFEDLENLRKEFATDSKFLEKIKYRIENYSSKHWRNWVRMKVCQRIANENFSAFTLSASQIRDIANEF